MLTFSQCILIPHLALSQAVDMIRTQLESIPTSDMDDSIANEVQVVMMTSAHPVWMQSTVPSTQTHLTELRRVHADL